MSHWRRRAKEGAEFWISCKLPAFLSNFSRLQLIQNSPPSVARRRQCDIRMHTSECLANHIYHGSNYSQITFRSNVLHHHFYLPEVDIQVQNGQGVLSSLFPSISDMGLACWGSMVILKLYIYCVSTSVK